MKAKCHEVNYDIYKSFLVKWEKAARQGTQVSVLFL